MRRRCPCDGTPGGNSGSVVVYIDTGFLWYGVIEPRAALGKPPVWLCLQSSTWLSRFGRAAAAGCFLRNWGDRFLMFASSFRANPRFPRRERAPQHEHYPWPTSPFTKWTASSLRLRREGLYGHISIDVQIFGDLHFGATRVKSGRTHDDVANNHGRNDSPKRVAFKRRSRHNGSITSYLPAKYDYHIF